MGRPSFWETILALDVAHVRDFIEVNLIDNIEWGATSGGYLPGSHVPFDIVDGISLCITGRTSQVKRQMDIV